MAVDLSIKGVPDALAEALRRRAAEHRHTVDEEVVGILEATVSQDHDLTASELLAEVRALDLHTPSESVAIIREDRDGRRGR